ILAHGKENNIRVLNISLGTDSTDSYLDDPFCKAVRAVVASGVTVVVAAGNYGLGTDGLEHYGTISSPGDEPSAITVGSSNAKGTTDRGDDVVNNFSSRGPTRGAHVDTSGVINRDNLLKPDLVAPGNKLVGALASDGSSLLDTLAAQHPELSIQKLPLSTALMSASGTPLAPPVRAGTAAVLLQATPGLTPPLIKAILQYSAQP